MTRWLWFAASIVLLDQASKLLVEHTLTYGQRIKLLPVFDLTLVYNTGAAFSFLAQASGWQRWLLSAVAVAAVGFILWLMKTQKGGSRRLMLSLSLILAGAIGNLIDRLIYGHVVDFLLFYWNNWHYPAFNVADAAITLGAVLLIWDELQRWRSTRQTRS